MNSKTLLIFAVIALVFLGGCPKGPECGNGICENGEDEFSCETDCRLIMPPEGTGDVAIKIMNFSGEPLDNLMVKVYSAEKEEEIKSVMVYNGEAIVGNLIAGNYYLEVYDPNNIYLEKKSEKFKIFENQTTEVIMTLDKREVEEGCIKEGGDLGAVIPGNDKKCCPGLKPYVEPEIVGTRGICVREEEVKSKCIDSDYGKNYYEKGYVEITDDPSYGENGRKYDYCYSENQLMEYYCQTQTDPGSESYLCPNGCKDGACIKETIEPSCIDSDYGKNYFVKGTGSGWNTDTEWVDFYDTCYKDYWANLTESCSGSKCYLAEKYCDGKYVRTEIEVACPNGCKDGACIEETAISTCVDSDNTYAVTQGRDTYNPPGEDRFVFGTVKYENKTYEDYCATVVEYVDEVGNNLIRYDNAKIGTHIIEQACFDGTKYRETTPYECPNGCKDRACIKESGALGNIVLKVVNSAGETITGLKLEIYPIGGEKPIIVQTSQGGLMVFDSYPIGNYYVKVYDPKGRYLDKTYEKLAIVKGKTIEITIVLEEVGVIVPEDKGVVHIPDLNASGEFLLAEGDEVTGLNSTDKFGGEKMKMVVGTGYSSGPDVLVILKLYNSQGIMLDADEFKTGDMITFQDSDGKEIIKTKLKVIEVQSITEDNRQVFKVVVFFEPETS